MSAEIKLNFYEEVVIINIQNKSYKDFKSEIAKRYGIDPNDVNELIVHYLDNEKVKNFVKNENDYNILVGNSKKFTLTVFLEIHEESRLYKDQSNKLNTNPFLKPININTKSTHEIMAEKIRQEIIEKERLLKETIERERLEIQKKKEEAKRKMDEENKRRKLEELRMKKLLMEKEQEELKRKEKQEIENEVTRLMEDNLERLKKTLIENTVTQSMNLVDKQLEKRMQMSQCKDVHSGYSCSGCGLTPILGVRFSCGVTPDFHLCENCEYFIGETHPYPLLKYRNTKQGNLKIKLIIGAPEQSLSINDFSNNFNNKERKDDDFILFENMKNLGK